MTAKDYRKAYEAALAELDGLVSEQERIEERIFTLRKSLNALYTLLQETGDGDWTDTAYAKLERIVHTSVTDDVFKVLTFASGPLTTAEIRDELVKLGGSLAEHRNPWATISAVVGRLVEQGTVKETVKNGRRAWVRNLPERYKSRFER